MARGSEAGKTLKNMGQGRKSRPRDESATSDLVPMFKTLGDGGWLAGGWRGWRVLEGVDGRMGGGSEGAQEGSCTGMSMCGCVDRLSPVCPSCPMCPLCIPMYPPLYRILSFYCGVLGIDGWRSRIRGLRWSQKASKRVPEVSKSYGN